MARVDLPALAAALTEGPGLARAAGIARLGELLELLHALFDGLRPAAGGVGHKPGRAPGVFAASDLPGPLRIRAHHELSYTPDPPRFLAFWCERPAAAGGETPTVDGAALFAALPARVRAPFEAAGVAYHRRLPPPGLPAPVVSWAEAFRAPTAEAAAAAARGRGLEARVQGAVLHTRVVLPALRDHPQAGPVWFNQAHAFWPDRRALGRSGWLWDQLARRSDRLQRSWATLGDGAPLPGAALAQIVAAMDALERPVPWRAGDLLLLDNHRVMHGRRPFTGDRAVFVAMADRLRGDGLRPG